MSYATLDQLYGHLPQLVGGSHDVLLSDMLARAHSIVNDVLGFEFGDYGDPEARDVECQAVGRWLELPVHEPQSVTDVLSVGGRGLATEVTRAVIGWLEERDGRLYLDGGWLRGWYRITAAWGYGPAPDSIVEVTLEVAANIWRGRDMMQWQNDVGMEGQGAVMYNRALNWAQRSIIEGVRTRVLGVIHA